jgi:hypothetical protein
LSLQIHTAGTLIFKMWNQPKVAVLACNPTALEAEAGGLVGDNKVRPSLKQSTRQNKDVGWDGATVSHLPQSALLVCVWTSLLQS